jgi:hypothetical protein
MGLLSPKLPASCSLPNLRKSSTWSTALADLSLCRRWRKRCSASSQIRMRFHRSPSLGNYASLASLGEGCICGISNIWKPNYRLCCRKDRRMYRLLAFRLSTFLQPTVVNPIAMCSAMIWELVNWKLIPKRWLRNLLWKASPSAIKNTHISVRMDCGFSSFKRNTTVSK